MNEMQASFLFHARERRYQVSELNREIANMLSVEFSDIWVEGEISDPKLSRQGHYYFTLKEENSVLQCVCFRGAARLLRVRPENGLAVSARGKIDVYEARGQYQFVVEAMELRGLGALQRAFELLKQKLEAEGLFSPERKRLLPSLPKRIGIVTSPTGAAIQDMLSVLDRRFPGLHIRIYPTVVQGETAPAQIAEAIRFFSESGWPDVLIVGRGGGSLEDLWAFNTEIVARAIAASKIPVVSAVGHETDFTIADFVADLRAPTPSAAAEIVVPRKADLIEALSRRRATLEQACRLQILQKSRQLHALGADRAHGMLQRRLHMAAQRLDDLDFRMRDAIRARCAEAGRRFETAAGRLARLDLRVRLGRLRESLQRLDQRLQQEMQQSLRLRQSRTFTLEARLRALSPLAILDRGYALVQRDGGQLVRDARELSLDEDIWLRFAKGRARAKVEQLPDRDS